MITLRNNDVVLIKVPTVNYTSSVPTVIILLVLQYQEHIVMFCELKDCSHYLFVITFA